MAPSVKISRRVAAVLLDFLDEGFRGDRAVEELRRALDVRPRKAFVSAPTRKQTKAKKKRTKKEETAEIRAAVFARCEGICEMCEQAGADDLHHAFGRVRQRQSEENCLALCRACHRMVTNNVPSASAVYWMQSAAFRAAGFPKTARELDALAEKHETKAGFAAVVR